MIFLECIGSRASLSARKATREVAFFLLARERDEPPGVRYRAALAKQESRPLRDQS